MDGWMDGSVKGGVDAAVSPSPALSCPNLFCLINSFYPSGWSDSCGCVVRPTSQQPLLPSLSLYCTFLPLYLSWPTCWAGPLSTRHAAVRKRIRHAVTMVTVVTITPPTPPPPFDRRPRKKSLVLIWRSDAPLIFVWAEDKQCKNQHGCKF